MLCREDIGKSLDHKKAGNARFSTTEPGGPLERGGNGKRKKKLHFGNPSMVGDQSMLPLICSLYLEVPGTAKGHLAPCSFGKADG